MKPIEKLCIRLKEELDIDADPNSFHRTRAGHWQRKYGAWSWFVKFKEVNGNCIGSQHSVTELLKADKLDEYHYFGDWNIEPITKKN